MGIIWSDIPGSMKSKTAQYHGRFHDDGIFIGNFVFRTERENDLGTGGSCLSLALACLKTGKPLNRIPGWLRSMINVSAFLFKRGDANISSHSLFLTPETGVLAFDIKGRLIEELTADRASDIAYLSVFRPRRDESRYYNFDIQNADGGDLVKDLAYSDPILLVGGCVQNKLCNDGITPLLSPYYMMNEGSEGPACRILYSFPSSRRRGGMAGDQHEVGFNNSFTFVISKADGHANELDPLDNSENGILGDIVEEFRAADTTENGNEADEKVVKVATDGQTSIDMSTSLITRDSPTLVLPETDSVWLVPQVWSDEHNVYVTFNPKGFPTLFAVGKVGHCFVDSVATLFRHPQFSKGGNIKGGAPNALFAFLSDVNPVDQIMIYPTIGAAEPLITPTVDWAGYTCGDLAIGDDQSVVTQVKRESDPFVAVLLFSGNKKLFHDRLWYSRREWKLAKKTRIVLMPYSTGILDEKKIDVNTKYRAGRTWGHDGESVDHNYTYHLPENVIGKIHGVSEIGLAAFSHFYVPRDAIIPAEPNALFGGLEIIINEMGSDLRMVSPNITHVGKVAAKDEDWIAPDLAGAVSVDAFEGD